jgi:hypothetical protein
MIFLAGPNRSVSGSAVSLSGGREAKAPNKPPDPCTHADFYLDLHLA